MAIVSRTFCWAISALQMRDLLELTDGRLGNVATFKVARFPTFQDVLRTFLEDYRSGAAFTAALLAVAGPIDHRHCTLTNTSWAIDARELKASFGFDVRIINDFQAVAYSLPSLASTDLSRSVMAK